MLLKGKSVLILYLLILTIASGQAEATKHTIGKRQETRQFSYMDGILLGVVEGFTEYLPISSTGHLILTNRFLGLDADIPLTDRDDNFVMVKNNDGTKVPLTLANATRTYAIIIQFGAILAVVLIYWPRILRITLGILGKDPDGLTVLRNLIVAFLPAAALGLLLEDFIESTLFGVYPVIIALIAGGIFMLIVTRWHRKHHPQKTTGDEITHGPDLHSLSIKQCLTVGLLQCVALWPGTSRSMMTIVGGYLIGLSPVRAAEFSFLLGLVTLSAASSYKALSVGPLIIQTLPVGPVLLGILVAAVSAALAVRWLVSFLTKYDLSLFAWYRIGLAILVLLTFV